MNEAYSLWRLCIHPHRDAEIIKYYFFIDVAHFTYYKINMCI